MPQTRSHPLSKESIEGYQKMMQETSTAVAQMEQHLKQLVTTQKMAEARIYEDEHRNVPGNENVILVGGVEVQCVQFTVPQGESWTIERVSAQSSDTAVTAFLVYRDQIIAGRMSLTIPAVVAAASANGTDTGSHILYLPERTQLFILAADGAAYSTVLFDANIQVRVRKRHQNKITTEEAYVLSGGIDQLQEYAEERDVPFEPHDSRHGDDDEDDTFSGDVTPPTPEAEPRPQPHFAQKVEQAIEDVVEYVEDKIL